MKILKPLATTTCRCTARPIRQGSQTPGSVPPPEPGKKFTARKTDHFSTLEKLFLCASGILRREASDRSTVGELPEMNKSLTIRPQLRCRYELLERRDCPAGFSLTALTAEATVTEGNAAEFQISMDAASPIPQSVMVSTESLTALLGTDYMFRTQRITFFPGETEKNFSVQSLRDAVDVIEGAETLRVFVRPIGGTPDELSALMTIDDYVPPAQFTITFNFDGDVPQSVIDASAQAAARWTEVIVGDLPDVVSPTFGLIDDILITVQMGLLDNDTDGDGNTLANARPLEFRTDSAGLPYLAEVGVDPADTDRSDLVAVMTHEFGHALGFPQSNGWRSNVIPDTDAPTHFVGTNAVREYNTVFGASADSAGVPIEQDGGAGTAFAHWDDEVFGNELMTGFIDPGGNPLSVITVGAFEDMGYTVDYAAADAYIPPAAVAPAATGTAGAATAIRRLPARLSFPDRPSVILTDDEAARELVRTALDDALSTDPPHSPLDLRHLADDQRAVIAAWASIGQEPATSLAAHSQGHLASRIAGCWYDLDRFSKERFRAQIFASADIV
jgi:hypothetical protein